MKKAAQQNDFEGRLIYERMIEVLLSYKPVEDLKETVHLNFLGYGTAAHEFFENRKHLMKMAETQAEQMRHQHIEITRKPIVERMLGKGTTYLIVEEFELYMEDQNHRIPLRLSTLLERIDEKWLITHFHGSTPDTNIAEDEALPEEGLRKKNEALEAKIKERTRDLEIEAALERVRARTMAMQRSEDLQDTALLLFQQVEGLGVPPFACGFNIWDADGKTATAWMGSVVGLQPPFKTDNAKDIYLPIHAAAQRGESLLVLEQAGEDLAAHYAYLATIPTFRDIILKNLEREGVSIPTFQIIHCAFFSQGYLMFISYEPVTAFHDVFKRFATVFEQTYTRFLDLQKAEAQAREATIEASLERVRSKAMVMHRSEELGEVATVLHNELLSLNVHEFSKTSIIIHEEPSQKLIVWGARTGSDSLEKSVFPLLGDQILQKLYDTWRQEEEFFTLKVEGKALRKHIDFVFPKVSRTVQEDAAIKSMPDPTFFHCAFFCMGYLELMSDNELSEASSSLLVRFAKVFDQAYRRFLDLQKAEAQAREAQVEAALERVRSRTMAMQKSEDLIETAADMFQQIQALGRQPWGCGFNIFDKDEKAVTQYMSAGGMLPPFRTPLTEDPFFISIYEARQRKEDFLVMESKEESLAATYRYMFSLPGTGEIFENLQNSGFEMPKFQITHCAYFSQGYLMFITFEPEPESHDIFKRYAKVFEQTYTRFLDLQKAEAQAREATIEAALERVRTRSMTMHKSDELSDVATVLYQQLSELSFKPLACAFAIADEKDRSAEIYITANGTVIPQSFKLPYHGEPTQEKIFKAWRTKGDSHIIIDLQGDALAEHLEFIAKILPLQEFFEMSGESQDDRLVLHLINFKYGFIGLNFKQPNESAIPVFLRFAQVFEQAYTRFLDLQKAEAQAREATIETALEKVRSRSLAMHNTEELQEVVAIVAEKLQELGVILDANGVVICTYFPDSKNVLHWIAAPDFSTSGHYLLPYFDHPILNIAWESKNSGVDYFSKSFTVEEKNSFYEYAFAETDYKNFPEEFKKWIFQNDHHALSFAWAKNSAILIPSHTGVLPTESDRAIMKRFAKVFEQAYIRFMDLKNAETLAHKARIEVALERVRARALAMQRPEELVEVADVMRHEMGLLGVEALETSSIYLNKAPTGEAECWYSLKGVREGDKNTVADHFDFNYKDTWVGREMLQFHRSKDRETSIAMTGENRKEWIDYCAQLSPVFEGYYGKVIPERTYHLCKFSNGAIGAATPGDISAESWDLLRRAASVFSLAYSRFKDLTQARIDLQLLKEEKQRAENALIELKATQSQLIQSEKMASLGELTAGIAHEIQNPLNFVNNFSELSNELLDEMKEEFEKGDREEAFAIADDIKQNLEKINHHGKRADAIVKGMLQHSRSSSGAKEPTDLNALCDEYLRLAYHGLRAKDKAFNATLNTDLDPSVGKVKVVPQDMGRVVLNLITNAFYAVDEKKKSGISPYEPTVWVSTKKDKDQVTITVRDNGNGIPDKIKDKIFQPFFTTKPTGQGTGLGLSLSYDIVKAHGGELKVETQNGEGTTFMINLPLG